MRSLTLLSLADPLLSVASTAWMSAVQRKELVPLFFMDLSQAEQMEIDAYRQRYNHLLIIAGDKQCGIQGQPIPDFKQSTPPSTTQSEKKN